MEPKKPLPEKPKEPKESLATEEIISDEDDVIITPNKVVNKTNKEIDYTKIVKKFGCKLIDDELLARIEKISEHKVHPFLTRGIFFTHR